MRMQKNKKTVILTILFMFAAVMLLSGCTKTATPVEVSKTETLEINVTTSTSAVTEEITETTPETTTETTAASTTELIFSSLSGNQGIIYICNPDGSNLQKLIEDGINTSPSWDSQHSKIVFISIDPASGISGLYVFDMKSKSKSPLLKRFSPRDPSFSPDGKT